MLIKSVENIGVAAVFRPEFVFFYFSLLGFSLLGAMQPVRVLRLENVVRIHYLIVSIHIVAY